MKDSKIMQEFVYPGSFDPFTRGHEDIALRASAICDKLHVVILNNGSKEPCFSLEERLEMVERALAELKNVEISYYEGLLVDYLREHDYSVVVRGIRAESDFRYEQQLFATNLLMYPDYETLFLPSRADYSYTSSSTVREVARYGGDISKMVPESIKGLVLQKFDNNIL